MWEDFTTYNGVFCFFHSVLGWMKVNMTMRQKGLSEHVHPKSWTIRMCWKMSACARLDPHFSVRPVCHFLTMGCILEACAVANISPPPVSLVKHIYIPSIYFPGPSCQISGKVILKLTLMLWPVNESMARTHLLFLSDSTIQELSIYMEQNTELCELYFQKASVPFNHISPLCEGH